MLVNNNHKKQKWEEWQFILSVNLHAHDQNYLFLEWSWGLHSFSVIVFINVIVHTLCLYK